MKNQALQKSAAETAVRYKADYFQTNQRKTEAAVVVIRVNGIPIFIQERKVMG